MPSHRPLVAGTGAAAVPAERIATGDLPTNRAWPPSIGIATVSPISMSLRNASSWRRSLPARRRGTRSARSWRSPAISRSVASTSIPLAASRPTRPSCRNAPGTQHLQGLDPLLAETGSVEHRGAAAKDGVRQERLHDLQAHRPARGQTKQRGATARSDVTREQPRSILRAFPRSLLASAGSTTAGVAQSAERLTRNEQVRGSIPLPGSTTPQVTAQRAWPPARRLASSRASMTIRGMSCRRGSWPGRPLVRPVRRCSWRWAATGFRRRC